MTDLIPLLIAGALLLLAGASYRLNKAAQPLRLQFAEKSERLIADPSLPLHLQTFVRQAQATAFSDRAALLFGVFFIPFMAVAIVLNPAVYDKASRYFAVPCAETQAKFHEVMRLHDRITFLNHPVMVLLLEFEITMFVAPAIALLAIFRGLAAEKLDREVAMGLIDKASSSIRNKQPIFAGQAA